MGLQTVLLVDDHSLIREGLAALISREPSLVVCASVKTLKEARTVLSSQTPDLLVTDLSLPDGSGLEFVKDVRTQFPKLPIIVLSMHDEMLYAERALHAGANAYLMKETPGTELLAAIHAVLNGDRHVSENMSFELLSRMTESSRIDPSSPLNALSDRELQVFEYLGHGKASGEIAQILGLSTRTVEGHRMKIRKKLKLQEGGNALEKKAIRWIECGETG